jgi:hypothetical protein
MVSDSESARDTIQVVTETAADHLGKIAMIVSTAIRDIATELGDWVTDVVELRDATQRAREDAD